MTQIQTIKHETIKHHTSRLAPKLSSFLKEAELTPHEICVVYVVLNGRRHKQSAEVLGCTEKNVKFHLTKIYEKLNVKSKSEMIVLLRDVKEAGEF